MRIEEATSGMLKETALSLEPVSEESVKKEDSICSPNSDELEGILFLIDDARLDSFNDSDNECNENTNNEVEINTGNITLPADTPDTNDATAIANESLLTYHQKLEAKRKERNELIGKRAVKE